MSRGKLDGVPTETLQVPGTSEVPGTFSSLRWVSLTLLTVAAFALRAFGLGARELRGDETFGQMFSAQSIANILAETVRLVEPHPPFDYFLLHFWQALAGATEFALRYHSLFFGVLAVPLVYWLAQALWEGETPHPSPPSSGGGPPTTALPPGGGRPPTTAL
ncbi:MAG: hypothetical protein ACUVV0_17125, partial [Anaerolineae bacterium]